MMTSLKSMASRALTARFMSRPAAGFLEDLPFQRRAGLAGLLETGRDDDRAFRAGVDAFADDAGDARRRRDDDGEIDGVSTASIFGYALMRAPSDAAG